jgi:hypothetical protein
MTFKCFEEPAPRLNTTPRTITDQHLNNIDYREGLAWICMRCLKIMKISDAAHSFVPMVLLLVSLSIQNVPGCGLSSKFKRFEQARTHHSSTGALAAVHASQMRPHKQPRSAIIERQH